MLEMNLNLPSQTNCMLEFLQALVLVLKLKKKMQ